MDCYTLDPGLYVVNCEIVAVATDAECVGR